MNGEGRASRVVLSLVLETLLLGRWSGCTSPAPSHKARLKALDLMCKAKTLKGGEEKAAQRGALGPKEQLSGESLAFLFASPSQT